MNTNETFTLSAIAKRLGLSAPTVSNWRNRYDDFPRPMETVGKRELWTLLQIQEFMKARGLDGRERRPSALRPKERDYSSVSGLVASLSEFLTPEEAVLYLLAQAWNINKGASKPDLRNLATTLRDHPSLSPLSSAVTAALKSEQLSILDAVQKGLSAILADKSRRLIFVSEVRIQWGQLGRDRASTTSPDRLSAVMASLASGKSVLELCAGLGSSLRHIKNAAQIVAQEIDPIAVAMLQVLLEIEGVGAQILNEDSISELHRDWLGKFDVVLAVPPSRFQPRENDLPSNDPRWLRYESGRIRSEDSWILNALGYLSPSGTAVIALPTNWMTASGSARFRKWLVGLGHLQAAISLGAGFYTDNRVEMTLLILSGSLEPNRPILIVDARNLDEQTPQSRSQDKLASALHSLLEAKPSERVIEIQAGDLVVLGSLLEFFALKALVADVTRSQPGETLQHVIDQLEKLVSSHQDMIKEIREFAKFGKNLHFGKRHSLVRLSDIAALEVFSKATDPKWPSFEINQDDIILPLIAESRHGLRPWCNSPSIPYEAGWQDTNLASVSRVCRIRLKKDATQSREISPLTIFFYLGTPVVQDRLQAVADVQSRPYIPMEVIANLQIPSSPDSVQKMALELYGRSLDLELQAFLTGLSKVDTAISDLIAALLESGQS
jgi:hypothetical protein